MSGFLACGFVFRADEWYGSEGYGRVKKMVFTGVFDYETICDVSFILVDSNMVKRNGFEFQIIIQQLL